MKVVGFEGEFLPFLVAKRLPTPPKEIATNLDRKAILGELSIIEPQKVWAPNK